MAEQELLPCPFKRDGETHDPQITKTALEPHFYSIVCSGCCSIAHGETLSKVIDRWNARSDTSDYRRGVEDAATVVENKGVEYEKLGDYGINQGFVQRVITSNEIAEAIRALLTAEQGTDGWTQDVPTEQGWYWHCHDEKSVPFPLSILRDGAGKQKCFVAHDQAGLLRAIDCDEYGGWWKRILLPAPPDAVVDEKESK